MGTDIIDSIAVCGEHLDEQWLSQDNTVIRGIFNQNAQVNIIGGRLLYHITESTGIAGSNEKKRQLRIG